MKKSTAVLLAVLLILITIYLFQSGILEFNRDKLPGSSVLSPASQIATIIQTPAPVQVASSKSVFPYGQTNDLYQDILNGFIERQDSVWVYDVETEEVKETILKILKEHPEIFWITQYRISTHKHELGVSLEITTTSYEPDKITSKEDRLDNIVYGIMNLLPEDASDYEKMLFIHDFIINTTSYDYDATQSSDYCDARNAYGCLVEHKAVCAGYAKAFQLLMNSIGIPCGRVTGSIIGRGTHEWNYVTLSDQNYYVDVTFDDPVFQGSDENMCSHAYFCISTAELNQTHLIDRNQNVPICEDTEFDYFRCHNLFIETYYPYTVVAMVNSAPIGEWVEIKFATAEQCATAYRELFVNSGFNAHYYGNNVKGYRYAPSSLNTIIRVQLY